MKTELHDVEKCFVYSKTKKQMKYEAYSESKGRLVSKKNIFVRHIFY